ncbi:MAG: hypothetical protein R2939_18850 [Kofleriaceae bacterium]
MASLTESLRDRWDGISPRERRLVVTLLVALPLTLLIYLGMQISDGLDAIEARNARTRKAILGQSRSCKRAARRRRSRPIPPPASRPRRSSCRSTSTTPPRRSASPSPASTSSPR